MNRMTHKYVSKSYFRSSTLVSVKKVIVVISKHFFLKYFCANLERDIKFAALSTITGSMLRRKNEIKLNAGYERNESFYLCSCATGVLKTKL